MKTKVVINNDRVIPMNLRVVDSTALAWQGEYYLIAPAQAQVIELDMPEGCSPYLKIWENNTAFLTYIDNQAITLMEGV
jgi:hypothetical protein